MSDKVTVDLTFPEPTNGRMYDVAESIATALDFHHACGGTCIHPEGTSILQIRVNDIPSGEGRDYSFAYQF